jgi:hypothetical protein
MILEVGGRQMPWIVDVQALAVWLHNVTTETESCALGILHFRTKAEAEAEQRQAK